MTPPREGSTAAGSSSFRSGSGVSSLRVNKAVIAGNAYAASRLTNLLHALDHNGAHRAARWAADQVAFDDPRGVAGLLEELRKTGADVAVTALAARAADAGLFTISQRANPRWARQFTFGWEPGGAQSLPWSWQGLTTTALS